MLNTDDNDIECNGVGTSEYVSPDGTRFYLSVTFNNLEVSIGDMVRINPDATESVDDTFYIDQVLSFYEDSDEMMYAEVRWFEKPNDLPIVRKKK